MHSGPPTEATMVGAWRRSARPPGGPERLPAGDGPAELRPPAARSHDNGAAPEDDGPGRRWWLFALGALVVVGIVIAALLLLRTQQVVVPNVVGSDQATAESVLQRAGFSVDTVVKTSTPAAAPGARPGAADPGQKADKGSIVTLTVSDGPGTTPIPARRRPDRLAGAGACSRRSGLRRARARRRVGHRRGGRRDRHAARGGHGVRARADRDAQRLVRQGEGRRPERRGADARRRPRDAHRRRVHGHLDRAGGRQGRLPGRCSARARPRSAKADKGSAVALTVAKKPCAGRRPEHVGDDEATAIESALGRGLQGEDQSRCASPTSRRTAP